MSLFQSVNPFVVFPCFPSFLINLFKSIQVYSSPFICLSTGKNIIQQTHGRPRQVLWALHLQVQVFVCRTLQLCLALHFPNRISHLDTAGNSIDRTARGPRSCDGSRRVPNFIQLPSCSKLPQGSLRVPSGFPPSCSEPAALRSGPATPIWAFQCQVWSPSQIVIARFTRMRNQKPYPGSSG